MSGPTGSAPPADAPAVTITRGVRRFFAEQGMASLAEVTLANQRRADILALASDGIITVVEVKSGLADFRSDRKWREYLDYCDRFFFAVDAGFPTGYLPDQVGVLIADGYGAAVWRPAEVAKLVPARRRAVTLRFALKAAQRLHGIEDPVWRAIDGRHA